MSSDPIIVLKFGSSVLTDESAVPGAVHEIYRWLRQGRRVVAVVSALGKTTDHLLARAEQMAGAPEPAGLAALLATGEATSAALLALALDRAGVPAALLDSWRVGLRTDGPLLDAEPRELNRRELFRALDERPVAVLAGFVGQDGEGRTSLLGRGGSDLTAFFVAQRLGAECCRLIKDVDGIYDGDPTASQAPRRFATLTWDDAFRLGGRVVQPKAIRYAERYGLAFEVSACGSGVATVVGPGPTRYCERAAEPPAAPRPLRVALLGLGTVGLGVYRHLAADPERFQVVGIAVRRPAKHQGDGVPMELFSSDPWKLLEVDSDLVVEAIGGQHPAADLVRAALDRGRDVVTANKAVVAAHGAELLARAEAHGAQLVFSATVGGGVPVIETVERVARRGRILAVEGVLNATTNFVLDRITAGFDLAAAVASAQENGFAEADPSNDLSGLDAVHKLVIVARAAFGVHLTVAQVDCRGIDDIDAEEVRAVHAAGSAVRLVASCRRTPEGVVARVCPLRLPADHPLAQPHDEQNRVLVQPEVGPAVIADGKGAGRWPTAESVTADIFDVYRLRRDARLADEDDAVLAPSAARVWASGVPIGSR
jgi:homoserine dehydrogenase